MTNIGGIGIINSTEENCTQEELASMVFGESVDQSLIKTVTSVSMEKTIPYIDPEAFREKVRERRKYSIYRQAEKVAVTNAVNFISGEILKAFQNENNFLKGYSEEDDAYRFCVYFQKKDYYVKVEDEYIFPYERVKDMLELMGYSFVITNGITRVSEEYMKNEKRRTCANIILKDVYGDKSKAE